MILVLALSLLGTSDPPIRLKLSDDVYVRGEQARVKVQADRDGYLVVLRVNAQGRIRVLFPLDPTEDNAVRGGREYEIRGRGDRATFVVDETEGAGRVFAAISAEPFHFDNFSRNGHWDYSVLAFKDSTNDAEGALLDLVAGMTDARYEYDIVTYTVEKNEGYRHYGGVVWGGWGGWGRWGWYSPRYRCWGCRPYYYGPWISFGTTVVW
jgi:hypothetical protein